MLFGGLGPIVGLNEMLLDALETNIDVDRHVAVCKAFSLDVINHLKVLK